jgi:hypothetical protein
MNVRIKQSQLKNLVEQSMGGGFSPQYQSGEISKIAKDGLDHNISAVLQIVTAFVPIVGPFVSAGIGLMDAAQYAKEGDSTSAGIVGTLSMLPFIGPVVVKIPGVKTLGSKGMAALGKKLSSGQKNFTKQEQEVLKGLSQNQSLVKSELRRQTLKMDGVAREVAKLKEAYISRLGQDSYEKLLKNFFRGVIDKDTFLKSLRAGGKAQPNLANFMVIKGVRYFQKEVAEIERIASELAQKNYVPKKITIYKYDKSKLPSIPVTITMEPMNLSTVQKLFPDIPTSAQAFVTKDKMYFVPQNIKNVEIDDMVSLITHEMGHIKDPARARSLKLNKTYKEGLPKTGDAYKILKNTTKGTPEYEQALKEFNKYYKFHPFELVANNAMVLNNLTTQTMRMMKTERKGVVLQGLQEVINFFTKNKTKMSYVGKKMLVGPEIQESKLSAHIETLGTYNQKEYKKLAEKMVRQAEYLKSQVNMAK